MAIIRGNYNFEIYRGDAYTFQFQLTDYDEVTQVETPIDITNFELSCQVRYSVTAPDIWFTMPLTKTDPSNGIFEWNLTKAESEGFLPPSSTTPANGVYDMQLITNKSHATDERILTFMKGNFSIVRDVTRDPSTPRMIQRR